ncbi:MAG: methionyl-tRNA formyltransferase [Patescibacteria group bacterium]|nr:methionyl-tRNA formyltransferase [Patescibacteria group bacterium]
MNLKIIFMGTPHFAEVILRKMIAAKYNIVAVFTQPDKEVGRKREMKKSPVKKLAEKNNIQVFEPQDLKETPEKIAKMRPDLIIIAAYGKILPKSILDIPKYGSINIHASLLPKFRGASPVQQAILEGEKETGITLMLMSEKFDAGEIIAQEKLKIAKDDNAQTLTEKLAKTGARLLPETLPSWISGSIKAAPQDEKKASFCKIIKKEDGKMDWNDSAEKIFRKYKAYFPWPGIYSFFSDNGKKKRLKLVEIKTIPGAGAGEKPGEVVEYEKEIVIQTGKGIIILKKVQPEGKKEMDIKEFLRGRKDFRGMILS